MFLHFIERVVADNIETFKVIGKKYLKVCVMSLVKRCVDVMVICAGIRGIFYLEVFHENEVFYNLNVFNLTIFAEEITNVGFARLI